MRAGNIAAHLLSYRIGPGKERIPSQSCIDCEPRAHPPLVLHESIPLTTTCEFRLAGCLGKRRHRSRQQICETVARSRARESHDRFFLITRGRIETIPRYEGPSEI